MASRALGARLVVNRVLGRGSRDVRWFSSDSLPRRVRSPARRTVTRPESPLSRGLKYATPGQAGLPAEFKHINKRRRRNLLGFPQ